MPFTKYCPSLNKQIPFAQICPPSSPNLTYYGPLPSTPVTPTTTATPGSIPTNVPAGAPCGGKCCGGGGMTGTGGGGTLGGTVGGGTTRAVEAGELSVFGAKIPWWLLLLAVGVGYAASKK